MSTKQFRVHLGCQCEGCVGDVKGYVKKITEFWHQLFDNASVPSKKPHLELECGCTEKIINYLENVQGVDEIDIDLVKDIVTVKGNFEDTDVINCFREKMGKKAELVDQELGKPILSDNGYEDPNRRGRRYGEIEELW